MIYAPISTFMLGFAYLRMFVDFDLTSLRHASRMKIFEALWTKKGSKRGRKTSNMDIP